MARMTPHSKTRLLPAPALALAVLMLPACALREPYSSEQRAIDSVTLSPPLAQGVEAAPFCLHLRYNNAFFAIASESRTEAWVTDGPCHTPGAKRVVDTLRVSWRHDFQDARGTRQCHDTDTCIANEQHVIEGRNIRCASAHARHGNQTAFVTTDQAICH